MLSAPQYSSGMLATNCVSVEPHNSHGTTGIQKQARVWSWGDTGNSHSLSSAWLTRTGIEPVVWDVPTSSTYLRRVVKAELPRLSCKHVSVAHTTLSKSLSIRSLSTPHHTSVHRFHACFIQNNFLNSRLHIKRLFFFGNVSHAHHIPQATHQIRQSAWSARHRNITTRNTQLLQHQPQHKLHRLANGILFSIQKELSRLFASRG